MNSLRQKVRPPATEENTETTSKMPATRQNLVYIAVGLVLVIGLGFVLSLTPIFKKEPNYVAVYLTTGDLYFGKLSRFPNTKLSDILLLQANQQGQLSLVRLEDAVWGPKGTLSLSKDKIVWIAPLAEGSQIIQAIEGVLPLQQVAPSAIPQPQPGVGGQPESQPEPGQ